MITQQKGQPDPEAAHLTIGFTHSQRDSALENPEC